jgi:PAS domain S-box-containing protein
MSFTARSATVRYACAVALALAAVLARSGLDALYGPNLPLITFFPAIMASAWLGGFGPGLTTTLLCVVSTTYRWLNPGLAPQISTLAEVVALAMFIAIGGLISLLTETLHRSERRRAVDFDRERAMRAEAERGREAMAWLAAIVHDSYDAIVSKTLDGVITSWNPAAERLFGYTAAEAVGQPITLIVPPDRFEEERGVLARLQESEAVEPFESERLSRDGRRIPVSLTISRVTDATGRVVGASTIVRDITERNAAEAARRELERHKDQFLAIVSHEMRNPLGAIMAAASVLALDPALAGTRPRALDIIRRQTGQLSHLVDDLLDIARLTMGNIALHKRRLNLAALVEGCVTAVVAESERVDLSLEPVWIDADPARMEQICSNLVANALKFTPRDAPIRVQVGRVDHQAVLRVTDEGMGIEPELLPRVFELFTQGGEAPAGREGGLGIGLTIVRRLVELHDGRIEAHSDGPGRGSEFVVRFPVLD